ncbi:MAG: chloramphenicol acetyltransferase [Gemmatimonadaceae bacterium]
MNQTETAGHFLDLASWNRRQHFDLFRGFENPFFSVCVDVDATVAWEMCRADGSPSFYVVTLFHSLRAANDSEAFRMRIRGDRVWVHDSVRASATVLRDDETFGFGIFPPAPSFAGFQRHAADEMRRAKQPRPLEIPRPGEDDLIYHSSLPWMRFTSFTNALNGGKDSVPRVVFGKCTQQGGRWLLPVAVEVHHALVDGLDVARYLERMQRGLSGDVRPEQDKAPD